MSFGKLKNIISAMSHEQAPALHMEMFSSCLKDIVGPKDNPNELGVKTRNLKTLDLAIIHDPSPTFQEHTLMLQEKPALDRPVKTISIRLSERKFTLTSYHTPNNIQKELQKTLDEVKDRKTPLSIEDMGKDVSGLLDLAQVLKNAEEKKVERNEHRKAPDPEDIIDVLTGLSVLLDGDEDRADELFTSFFYMHYI